MKKITHYALLTVAFVFTGLLINYGYQFVTNILFYNHTSEEMLARLSTITDSSYYALTESLVEKWKEGKEEYITLGGTVMLQQSILVILLFVGAYLTREQLTPKNDSMEVASEEV